MPDPPPVHEQPSLESPALERLSASAFRDADPIFTVALHVEAEDPDQGEGHGIETATLRLESVDALHGDTPREDDQPFSLLFRSPDGYLLPQAIHRLENPTLGPLDLFLVCLGPDPKGEGSLFEAIFT